MKSPIYATVLLGLTILMGTSCDAADGDRFKPVLETGPSPYPGDSLDDATVWIHPADPDLSVIVTTLKASNQKPVQPTGILTYDLSGRELQFLQGGTPNNVDSRPGFPFESGPDTLIAASHWWSDEIGLYQMNSETRQLREVSLFQTQVEQLRGLCVGKLDTQFQVFGVGSSGVIEQYNVLSAKELSLNQRWQLSSEAEGCVVDDEAKRLYVSEENVGLWRFDLTLQSPPVQIAKVGLFSPLKRGLEGLALLGVEGKQHLVVSVQEQSRFAIFDVTEAEVEYLGSFRVAEDGPIDLVTKTDGIHIETQVTPKFPSGMLIVHDDENLDESGSKIHQNFKVVHLNSLIEFIKQQHQP